MILEKLKIEISSYKIHKFSKLGFLKNMFNFYYQHIKKLYPLYIAETKQALLRHKDFSPIAIEYARKAIYFNRMAFIAHAIASKRTELKNKNIQRDVSYLEIGCNKDVCFNAIPTTAKVGVDPVSGGNIRINSDEFFIKNQSKFDVIFIDGLHEYDQIKRDTVNSLNALEENGFLFIHDMIPFNFAEEHVPRLQDNWKGDVWKIGFELRKTQGLDFCVILAEDGGLGMVKKNKKDTKLYDDYNYLKNLKFSDFVAMNKQINYISCEEGLSTIQNSL